MEKLDFVKISQPQIDLYIKCNPNQNPGRGECVCVCECRCIGVFVWKLIWNCKGPRILKAIHLAAYRYHLFTCILGVGSVSLVES